MATDTADIDAFFAAIESPVTEATAAAVVQHTEQATDALPADVVPRVELALYNRAIGTSAWKEQLDRDGVPVKVCYEVPPDVAAAKALLAAHAPERYGAVTQPERATGDTYNVLVSSPEAIATVERLFGIKLGPCREVLPVNGRLGVVMEVAGGEALTSVGSSGILSGD